MRVNTELRQAQALSPQAVQAMNLVRMNAAQLGEYIERVALENPAIEVAPAYKAPPAAALPYTELACRDDGRSLADMLRLQLRADKLTPATARGALAIIESLDENGYLTETIEDLADGAGISQADMLRALECVQRLEPAGVAARDLSECLMLQLVRRVPRSALAERIAGQHLKRMANGQYSQIAHLTGSGENQVRQACAIIRGLDPKPGAAFSESPQTAYVIPDIFVSVQEDQLHVSVNAAALPDVSISSYCSRMLRESDSLEVKEYLGQKLQQARWLIHTLEQRRNTLVRCAAWIVNQQRDFFLSDAALKPLLQKQAAEELGVDPSTVSRIVREKYLSCGKGTFLLSDLFSRAAGQCQSSVHQAQRMLAAVIAGEDKSNPFTDAQLCEALAAAGIQISRRTVAKYRAGLAIPTTGVRRQRWRRGSP